MAVFRGALLTVALLGAPPALAQNSALPALTQDTAVAPLASRSVEPQLQLGRSSFALPVIDYQTPDGRWKRSSGVILGHDVSRSATIGIGFFKMKPRHEDPTISPAPTPGKSKKVSVGVSLRF